MGQRRAGLVRVGFRRAGSSTEADTASLDWAGEVKERIMTLAGFTPDTAAFVHEPFVTGTAATFANWTVNLAGGGTIVHSTTLRGGVCEMTNFGLAFADDITWAGVSPFLDEANEKLGIAFRLNIQSGFNPASALSDVRFGLINPGGGNNTYIGSRGVLSQPNLSLFASGPAGVNTGISVASLGTAQHELMLIQSPIAGSRVVRAFLDGTEIGRVTLTTTLVSRVPTMQNNNGLWNIDDVVFGWGPALS